MTGSASWLRWLLLGAAIVSLSLGFLVRGDTLATFVATLAPDGKISADTARQVASGRVGFLVLGAALFALSFAPGALVRVLTVLETLTIGIMTLVLRIGSRLGNAASEALARLPERRAGAWPVLAIVVLVASVLALALWSQSVQPPFHAEGINLQPARNLVLHGIYATRSNLGFDLDTWKITTGPGMLIPTALAFRLFGISMHTADMVALVFIVGFLLITYGVLGRHYGYGTTVLGLFFFVFTSGNIFYGASRGYTAGSFGDAPAVFYFIIGAALWGGAVVRQSSARLIFAGIAFGLAFHTKWLFLFTLPAVILAWALLAIGGRRLSARTFLLPILGIGIVTAAILAMRVSELGLRGEALHIQRLLGHHFRRAAGVDSGSGQVETIFTFARPLVTLAQVDFWSFLGVFLAVPAYAYAVAHLRRRPEPLPVYIMAFISIWALWWILLNYDLPEQHILFILPFIQIYVAKLLIDGYQALSRVNNGSASRVLARCGLAAIALIIVGKTFLPFLQIVDSIGLGSRTLTPAYREFVAFVDENTEPNAIFSGWTWSSPWWLSIETDRTIKDRSRYPFEQRESVPEYFVISPEWPIAGKLRTGWPNMSYASRWGYEQNEKRRDFAEHHCTHLLTTGDEHKWTIYRINPLPAGAVE